MRAKDKNLKEASSRADELAEAMEQEREYSRRRDLTIQGLVNEVHKKEKEVRRSLGYISAAQVPDIETAA